jgi:hypothetical protein
MIDDHILNHPLTENEKDVQDKIDSALEMLLDAYQMVGNKEFGYENENNTY